MQRERSIAANMFPSVLAGVVIVILALLPDLAPTVSGENQTVAASHGRIQEIVARRADEPLRPPLARVEILDGPQAGTVVQAYVEGPGGSQIVANYQPGDEVVVTTTRDESGNAYIAVADRWRTPLLGGYLLIFCIFIVLVGGLRGARALLSLGLTIAVILKLLVPLVINGVSPVPLAVLTATAVTVVTILLTEGRSRMSVAAILGTAGALALTGLLAAAATAFASFTYSVGSDLAFVQTADGRGLDLRGLLLAAIILGGVGVLDDVTVTQAAVVAQLADQGARGRRLLDAGLNVGRSHVAATVNTLFLAYVGVGLPLIVTLVVSNRPRALVFNSEEIATEVIRTLVGSLGIVAAMPFTTVVAAAIFDRPDAAEPARGRRRDPAVVRIAAATVVVVLVLALTAILPLGQGRTALTPTALGPSSVPGSLGPGSGEPVSSDKQVAGHSAQPAGSAGLTEPTILARGQPFKLPGDALIEITVTDVNVSSAPPGTRVAVDISYRNAGFTSFAVDPAAWNLLASDGEFVPMTSVVGHELDVSSLAPGATRAARLAAVVAARPQDTFVSYSDPSGNVLFAIAANGS